VPEAHTFFWWFRFLFVPLQIESHKTETMENTAYNTLQARRVSTNTLVKKGKSTANTERRMSVEEYFGKVLKKLDEHYAGLQEGRD
jgi:hypothetical protein